MEFITTYQMPLIFGGLLIIMGLIGYEADQREKLKNGEKLPKQKKKSKKELAQEQTVIPENTVTVVTPEASVENANYQYDATVANTEYANAEVGAQPVVYDNVAYQGAVEQPYVADQTVSATNNESLQPFMEPAQNVQTSDTFGMNDMSSFQVPQNTNADSSTGNIDAWKL